MKLSFCILSICIAILPSMMPLLQLVCSTMSMLAFLNHPSNEFKSTKFAVMLCCFLLLRSSFCSPLCSLREGYCVVIFCSFLAMLPCLSANFHQLTFCDLILLFVLYSVEEEAHEEAEEEAPKDEAEI
ncbi:Os08g0129800 [Oryza sativa Japonica Group]|jgi:hypothetical protein|uniref:Os08g0129800 protein n=2 Tax=Oryza sativa subsp. japonica TaxID=39947 RepID=A0A979HLH2_ORYSJ|nr:hypothetical protein OsJ_25926 [Oryza sativa Japonica Group]KAF2917942.1 hypothetical protein DAI22_08g021250 [Oryza sativa Japonica Group]BAF22832.1 Os08g0129800 [Oryza sativa Japonica Group]BAG89321.1 unnamed protein product [Oryza sativa Japonica Group]|eukprot:NP_001060918.1 Os08g0129800 [Oryza sativa Japonica Group]